MNTMTRVLRQVLGRAFTTGRSQDPRQSLMLDGMSLIVRRIRAGSRLAFPRRSRRGLPAEREAVVKVAMKSWLVVALLLLGAAIGRAYDADETVLNVQVTSADHETEEGYFTLGEQATVMVKPGSELFRFLNRNKGQKVKIVLTPTEERQLSRIDR